MSGVAVRPWFKSQERQWLLRSVEQLPWESCSLTLLPALSRPWSRYFRTGFLKVWASDLLRKKPLASGIDQSFEFQPCNKSMEAWEREVTKCPLRASTLAVAQPITLIHLSALTLMRLIVSHPCTLPAASDTGLVKCSCQMLEQTAPGRVVSSDLQSR